MNQRNRLQVSDKSRPKVFSPHTADTSPQPDAAIQTSLTGVVGKISKRTIDIVLSLPFVLLVLPPLAVAVRLAQWKQSSGPLFFRQERCGLNNKAFTILKFRTMNVMDNADISDCPEQRVFPLGQILRATKLDEIPQFVNVLLGAMSIVGPRPHHYQDCVAFSDVVEDYALRTITKPGITGLAQYTEYRGDFEWNCTHSRVSKDLDYIRRWSPVLDLVIIFKTASVIGRKSLSTLVNQTQFATPALSEIPKRSLKHPAVENRHRTAAQVAEERRAA